MARLQSTVTIHDATLRALAREYVNEPATARASKRSRRLTPYPSAWRHVDERVIATAMRLAKRNIRRITHDGGALIVHNNPVW